jgi:hypothetical protein
MRKVFFLLISILLTNLLYSQVYVKGYMKKNGTYVEPHYRSSPDKNPYNNYSFPGNTNPYTGKTSTGNPDTYLDNYYNKNKSTVGSSYSNSIPQTTYSSNYYVNRSRLNYQTYNGSNFILSENYLEKRFPTDISIDRIMYKVLNIDNDEFYLTNINSLPLGYLKLRNGLIVKIYDLKHNEVTNINYILK